MAGHEPPRPLGDDVLAHWLLDPAIAFLNHGCFGACPAAVLEAQTQWRQRLERHPVELLERRRDELLAPAKAAVGRFVGADPDDFGFVTNATGGVNAVLRSLRFEPGDEIVATDHGYNAVRRTAQWIAGRSGARLVEVPVGLPVRGDDDVVGAVAAALGPRTRLVIVDHVASPTAVVFPVKRIIDDCAARGVDVLVDGAHAPGMLDLDVAGLGAAWYTGNLHKWVCAPKGAAFLWVRPDRQKEIHPTTISHFLGEGLAAEFAWQATRDITPWLCAKDAIEYLDGQFGWPRMRRHNHALATWAQRMLTQRLDVEPATPPDGSLLGSMATVALPDAVRASCQTPEALQRRLYEEHHLEVPVVDWAGRWWIRVSCQVYNRPQQYEQLAVLRR